MEHDYSNRYLCNMETNIPVHGYKDIPCNTVITNIPCNMVTSHVKT